MSVGGWLTENHHRPVAATRQLSRAQQRHCSRRRTQLLARSQPQQNRAGGQRIGLGHLSAQFRASAATDLHTPTPLTVETELPRPGRESTSRACSRRRGREVDSHVLSTEMARTPPPRRGGVGPGHVSPGQTPLHTCTSRTDAVRRGAVQRRIWRFASTRTGTRQQLVGRLPRRNQHATAS